MRTGLVSRVDEVCVGVHLRVLLSPSISLPLLSFGHRGKRWWDGPLGVLGVWAGGYIHERSFFPTKSSIFLIIFVLLTEVVVVVRRRS